MPTNDPLSNVGWYKHIKKIKKRSKPGKQRVRRKQKGIETGDMLAVQQAELMLREIQKSTVVG
jgi:hypothetical protein